MSPGIKCEHDSDLTGPKSLSIKHRKRRRKPQDPERQSTLTTISAQTRSQQCGSDDETTRISQENELSWGQARRAEREILKARSTALDVAEKALAFKQAKLRSRREKLKKKKREFRAKRRNAKVVHREIVNERCAREAEEFADDLETWEKTLLELAEKLEATPEEFKEEEPERGAENARGQAAKTRRQKEVLKAMIREYTEHYAASHSFQYESGAECQFVDASREWREWQGMKEAWEEIEAVKDDFETKKQQIFEEIKTERTDLQAEKETMELQRQEIDADVIKLRAVNEEARAEIKAEWQAIHDNYAVYNKALEDGQKLQRKTQELQRGIKELKRDKKKIRRALKLKERAARDGASEEDSS